MIQSEKADKLALGCIAVAVFFCLAAFLFAPKAAKADGSGGIRMDYEQKLFDTSKPITVDITMDTDNWQEMLTNATEKKWRSCDVVVNGRRLNNVGIRPKGDSSLSSIAANPNTNRYSFMLRFDKYQSGQRCWGLDRLCLNNNYGDATNMKEAMAYDMFRFLGADAPLYNYAVITVNGEYWGTYLALEGVNDAFLRRNYGTQKGALYKPGDGDGQEEADWELEEFLEPPSGTGDAAFITSDDASAGQLLESSGEGGADLNYIDENLESYWGIWPSEVTKTKKSDHRRVVEALKNMAEGNAPEQYVDMDNLLRYMAVHSFTVNNDSLSGDGAHNYYLYESDGCLNLIPWDYNLCFGAYEMDWGSGTGMPETATEMVNKPIDEPWQITRFFDIILSNGEYRARYHAYYQKLIDEYVLGGGFRHFYSRTRSQIDDLVKSDPNALYSYDAYDAAAKTLLEAVELRGQSIKGQLAGAIPSTAAGQKEHPEALIDASSINLRTMGSDNVGEDAQVQASEDDWIRFYREKAEQQNKARQETNRKMALRYLGSFFGLSVALLGVRWYDKRFGD